MGASHDMSISINGGRTTIHQSGKAFVRSAHDELASMHARWAALGSSEPPDHAPALYGHSLTSFAQTEGTCVVCFGGTTGEGVNSQVCTALPDLELNWLVPLALQKQ